MEEVIRLKARVGEEHDGALEALRVLARILVREAVDESGGTRLSVSGRVCRPAGRRSS